MLVTRWFYPTLISCESGFDLKPWESMKITKVIMRSKVHSTNISNQISFDMGAAPRRAHLTP